jgi:hypothetical protein
MKSIGLYESMYWILCVNVLKNMYRQYIVLLIKNDSTFFGLCKVPNLMNVLMLQLENPSV